MQSARLAQVLLQKGRQDQYAMNRLLDDSSVPDEIIGFHAQQAVEKMIKAVLAHHAVEYQRTHKLRRLVALLRSSNITYPPELTEAVALTPYAVELRYDLLPIQDDAAAPFDRQWAKRCVERIAEWASSVVLGENGRRYPS
jgi:HEPN domain-containing protein